MLPEAPTMYEPGWRQTTIGFAEHRDAERIAVAHVIPILTQAENTRAIDAWFVVRKGTHWRLRYRPTSSKTPTDLAGHLHDLRRAGHLAAVTEAVYEPEIHAFGGHQAMTIAHRLWHLDSRHLLTHPPGRPHRRELSMLQCTQLLRSAGLDWYEQGDVWARVSAHRDPIRPDRLQRLHGPIQRLLTADPAGLTHAGASPATDWRAAFTTTGQALRRLHDNGHLHRGLRDVLTHHVIFAFNRRGIPEHEQAALAAAARTVIFGDDPTLSAATTKAT
jgi:thiopeptide-type bacteriocin biosynthesis protein